jgi:hypothetical protein
MANLKAIECFSATAATNATTDVPQSDYQDGLNAALLKNKYRGLKATIYSSWVDVMHGTVTAGTSTAYTMTQLRDLDTFVDGLRTTFVPHTNCGADPTLAVGDLDAKPIKTATGGAIGAADLLADIAYPVRYDATAEQWRLLAPLGTDITAEIAAAITAALGTATDVLTGTSNKALTGDALWDSAAIVSVTMDNAMEIDLAAGVLFKASATLNTNSTISFANTTGKAGRTIQFKFTCDGSARTLTFPSGSVTDGGFATLTKQFAASLTHKCYCTIDEDGVYDWSFRSGIRAAA